MTIIAAMTPAEPFAADSTPALSALTPQLEALASRLGVKSVLVMRSDPDAMVVEQPARHTRVLRCDQLHGPENLDGSQRDVLQVSERSGHNI